MKPLFAWRRWTAVAIILLMVFMGGQLLLVRSGLTEPVDLHSELAADYAPWPVVFNPVLDNTQIVADILAEATEEGTAPPTVGPVWPTPTATRPIEITPPAAPTATRPLPTFTAAIPTPTETAMPMDSSPTAPLPPTASATLVSPTPTLFPATRTPSRTPSRTPLPTPTDTPAPPTATAAPPMPATATAAPPN